MAVSVGQVEQLIEKAAPRSWSEDWDNPGLLIGDSAQKVDKILLTLEATPEVIEEAITKDAKLIVAHHPMLFKPLKNLRFDNQAARMPLTLFKHGISYYCAHTNLDQSELSSSYTFARLLGLEDREFLAPAIKEQLVKIIVFVPENAVEQVRLALADEGVGSAVTEGEHSDAYAECFFQTKGQGMFRPLNGAHPAIGEVGELTFVSEVRLEGIVEQRNLNRAIKALHKAHPYEEPAYDLVPLLNKGKTHGYGMVGYLPEPMTLKELWNKFLDDLEKNYICLPGDCLFESSPGLSSKVFPKEYDLSSLRLAGDLNKKIKKIAITNGSGNSFVKNAIFKGADLFITGEIDYHTVLDSLEVGMAVGELGHFLSEIPMIQSLYHLLSTEKKVKGDVELIISDGSKVPWLSVDKVINKSRTLAKAYDEEI